MRPIRVLTWHTHGSYLHYLTQTPHQFLVPYKPGRPPGYGGRCGHFPWGDNVTEVPVTALAALQFDCILFQDDHQYEKDQYAYLSAAQRALPRIYLEHDPPRANPTNMAHPVDDPNILLVHVSHFNALMWDSGRTPARVIEHGVLQPAASYQGDKECGLVVINNLAQRGRRLGGDLFIKAREHVPLELVGMGAEALGGLGEIRPDRLAAFAARYRFMYSPIRYTSLGLAVIEAMMIGMPVVALATTEMATVIEDGVSGFIDTDSNALHAQMRLLISNPALARQLGERAREQAMARFNIRRFTNEWDQALRLVTGMSRSVAPMQA
jgi:hypothetical protein